MNSRSSLKKLRNKGKPWKRCKIKKKYFQLKVKLKKSVALRSKGSLNIFRTLHS